MEKDLISVIIPVYNVEKYLAKCVDSVIDQSYKNLEIILVDDGATDSSGRICDEYAARDSRIICIHKKNGGLSDARNTGIEKMTGKYVTFIDSDDYVDKYFIEVLYRNLCENGADISISDFVKVKEKEIPENPDEREKYSIICFDHRQSLEALYDDEYKYQFTTAWGKLFTSKLYNQIRFPKGRNYEDTATTHKVLDKSKKVVYTNRTQYFYLTRETSITNCEKYIKDDVILSSYDRVQYFDEKGYSDLLVKAQIEYIVTLMGVYARLKLESSGAELRRKKLYQTVKKYIKEHRNIISSNLNFRFRIYLFLWFPGLYSLIVRGLN